MPRLLLLSFTLLSILCSGCADISNSRVLVFGNTQGLFTRAWSEKAEADSTVDHLVIGTQDTPYDVALNIKFHHGNGNIVNLSSANYKDSALLADAHPDSNKIIDSHDVSLRKLRHGRIDITWDSGVTRSFVNHFMFYEKDEKLISLDISKLDGFAKLEVDGKIRDFPLYDKDMIYLFGAPTETLRFLQE